MQKHVLAALALVSLASACEQELIKTAPERRGDRGESCLVTNDCKSSLLCVANRCIDDDFALTMTAKVCVSAECVDTKDCCPPKSKSQLARCEQLQQDCAAGGNDFGECDEFEATCGACKATCTNHSCVAPSQPVGECVTNDDCFGDDTCLGGQCVECSKDADCGAGFICESGSCDFACIRDEECGALSACKTGRCERRDCLDDRECVAFTGRPDSVCAPSGQCSVPCADDAGCASLGGLFSCSEGFCTYAGCETNAECAALNSDFDLRGLQLCLDKAEADKVSFGGF